MGCGEYEPIARRYQVPIVITGFEPLDLLEGVLLHGPAARGGPGRGREPVRAGPCGARATRQSRRLIDDVFEVCDRKWRGVGLIPKSGFKLRDEYRDHDAERLFEVDDIETQESPVCISGQILKGLKKPHDCPAFGRECTPQTPLGATMVSSEGACAAYYAYGRHLERGRRAGICEPCRAGRRSSSQSGGSSSLGTRPIGDRLIGATIGRAFGTCPLPQSRYDRILLGHGSGGQLTAELIQRLFVPGFGNDVLGGAGGPGDRPARPATTAPRPRGSPSPPIRSWSGRSSSPAATSAGWRSTARSTTWPSAAPGRCSCRRRSSSKRGCRWPTCERIVASMRAGLRRGRRRAGHRRHQGRRSRQGRPGLHHDLRHRPGARGPIALDPRRPARRSHPRLGDDRRPRDRHHVGARGDRVRDRAGKRHAPR